MYMCEIYNYIGTGPELERDLDLDLDLEAAAELELESCDRFPGSTSYI